MADATTADELAVIQTVYYYAAGIDSRDWELYRSVFAPEVDIDFSSFNGRPPVRMRADDWVANGRPMFETLTATRHAMTNPRVRRLGADTFECRMYMQADHLWERNGERQWFTIVGEYTDRLQRSGSAWQLTAVTLQVRWEEGDKAMLEEARRAGRAAR